MATEIANMSVGLHFDSKSLKTSQIKAEKDFSKFGDKLVGGAKAMGAAVSAGLAAGAAGVAAITKAAVDSYANYEQLIGGVETLFKDSAGVVENYANQAYISSGLSANKYMETVTSFSASLLQGLGGDTAEAARIANQAVVDMSDNANKMGTSIEMIQNAYQGFAKQNYTMLDNLKLGYGGTASEMARLINDSGVLGDAIEVTASTVNSVSFDKMVEAIHVVQDNLGITGTTAKEASTTIQGSLNSLKASWENTLTGLADPTQDFGVLIERLIESAGTFAQNLIPVLTKALSGVADLVQKLAPVVAGALPKLVDELVGPVVDAAGELLIAVVDAIVESLPTIIEAIVSVTMKILAALPTIIDKLVDGFMKIVPILTNPTNLQKILNAGLTLFLKIVEALPKIIPALVAAIPAVVDAVSAFLADPNNIGMLVMAAVQLFMALVMAVPQILGALLGAFSTLVGNLWNGITAMFGKFAEDFGNFIGNIFKGAINGVLAFIENMINTPVKLINGFVDIINETFGGIGVHLGRVELIALPRLAEGGLATGASTAIIGEAGAEAVLPLERNTGNWSGLLAAALADEFDEQGYGGRGVVVNFYDTTVRNDEDIEKITRGISQVMRRQSI